MRYVALIDGSGDVWGARVPDFPGCHGGGATIEAAVEDVTRALREFAADMVTEGEEIPAASDMTDILTRIASGELEDGIKVYVPLLLDERRPVRANISLDAGLLKVIDDEAKRRGLTRSSFLASAALDKIAEGR